MRSAKPTVRPPEEATLVNWSGTHEVQVSRLYQPESVEELEAVVQRAHDSGAQAPCLSAVVLLRAFWDPARAGVAAAAWCGHAAAPQPQVAARCAVLCPMPAGQKLRCTGSGLSPNGISFCSEGMVSLALLDKVLEINREQRTVRVQAGVRVQQVSPPRVQAGRADSLVLRQFV